MDAPSASPASPSPLRSWIEDRRQRIEARLEALLPRADQTPAALHEAMRYAVLGGGKRLRPLLTLAAFEAVGGALPRDWPPMPSTPPEAEGAVIDETPAAAPDDPSGAPLPKAAHRAATAVYGAASTSVNVALDAGCAVEFLHAYSLVHDDLPAMDNDDLRRGRLTTHKAFGEATAILAGDALQALAFGVMAAALPAGRSRQAVILLAAASGSLGMCGGQMLDLEGEGKAVDVERVEAIDRWKTGALIACACEIGAYAAGADPQGQAALLTFGRHAGAAFQIVDDLLDRTGTAEQLGKTPGKDVRVGKQTLVAALGPEAARARAQRETDAALSALAPLEASANGLRALARQLFERTR